MKSAPLFPLPAPVPPRRNNRAFTLLELLISMALLSLLIVILMSMVDGSTKLWRHSENRVDSYREARGAINTISADLASILPSTNPKLFQWNSLSDLPASIEKPPESSHLFFLASQPSDAQDHPNPQDNKSDLCIVGYYLAYAKVSTYSEKGSLNLYRYFQGSDTTFEETLKTIGSGGTGSLVPTSKPPSPQLSAGAAGDELLARNVTDFKVRAYTSTGEEIVSGGTSKPATQVNFKQNDATPMPNVIEIEVTVVSNETAKRLMSLSDWKNKGTSDYKQNARTFTTRVRLPTDTAIASPTPSPSPSPTPTP